MALNIDFDSSEASEYEIENLFPNAGKRTVDAIYANNVEDRRESKRQLRTLQAIRGAPGTEYRIGALANIWKAHMVSSGME